MKKDNSRKTESMKIMIAYVAITIFNYDVHQNVHKRKDKRRILNAATRLVSYNEGYYEQNSDMQTMENFIYVYQPGGGGG